MGSAWLLGFRWVSLGFEWVPRGPYLDEPNAEVVLNQRLRGFILRDARGVRTSGRARLRDHRAEGERARPAGLAGAIFWLGDWLFGTGHLPMRDCGAREGVTRRGRGWASVFGEGVCRLE